MKNIYKIFTTLAFIGFTQVSLFAGNPDRAGSAGAGQLRISPWAVSGGLSNANSATVTGAEAIFSNVAGLGFTRKTEILFTATDYLSGADINVSALGFAQRLGENGGVFGLNVVTIGFGEIERTSANNPDGGLGTYKPAFSNIGVSYAKAFSNSIYGGITVRIFNESISDARGTGVSLDAGVRYVTGEKQNMHFGISLKNVGPPYDYSGDGFAQEVVLDDKNLTIQQRIDKFELPSLVNIGAAYDWHLTEDEKHIVSFMTTFTSNSFNNDQIQFGVEYKFNKRLAIRGGYMNEAKNDRGNIEVANAITGPSAGISLNLPFGQEKLSKFSIDYGYRATNPFNGVHHIGARIIL